MVKFEVDKVRHILSSKTKLQSCVCLTSELHAFAATASPSPTEKKYLEMHVLEKEG